MANIVQIKVTYVNGWPHGYNSIDLTTYLGMVQFWQSRSRKALWQVDFQSLLIHFMAEEPMIDVGRDRGLINSKCLHRALHPTKKRKPNSPYPVITKFLGRNWQQHRLLIRVEVARVRVFFCSG